jgi:D-xylose 1-dehydrogenase (NADP+, D-xylono-1,5-lactone-forming)
MTRLRFGILSVAKINDRLIPAFRKAQHAELRALASRDPGRANQAAAAAGLPVAHGSYEALLADPTIDAVYIPLPNTLHDEWARKAADAGKHVLCEKPLTPTAAEAQALADYCRAKGVTLMDGFMWPHHPRTAEMRRLIDAGEIGEVRRVSGAFSFRLPMDANNIRLRPEMAGGSLLDVGCYPVYGIRWAFGQEPVRAWATARMLHGVDVEMSGALWFADGRLATFDCGFTLPLRQWIEVTGTKATLGAHDMWLPAPRATYVVEPDEGATQVREVAEADQIVCMIDGFSRAALRREPAAPAPEEAVKTLRVLEALARSAREGRVVEV